MFDAGELDGCDYCVIGDPIGHSLSPQMQNAAFRGAGLTERYGKIRVPLADLPDFAAFARTHLRGFNITVPHKSHVLDLLDEIAPEARACGSVNTVKVESGRLIGCSTDGFGIEGALRHNFGLEIGGGVFLLVGAGGAAHAAAWHLAGNGAKALFVANRTRERAEALADALRTRFPGCAVSSGELSDGTFFRLAAASASVLLQCSSCGLKPEDGAPFALDLLSGVKLAVFDLIYRRTALLEYAQTHGLSCCDGREMLVFQGAKSFEFWTGKTADVDAMRSALQTQRGVSG